MSSRKFIQAPAAVASARPAGPSGLESASCLKAGVFGDWNLGGQAVQQCAGSFDLLFADVNGAEKLRALGFPNVVSAPLWSFDPDLHRREATVLASRNSTPAEHHRVLELMENGTIDVSAWPMESAAPGVMAQRFPLWLRREAGIVKAVVDWS